MFKPIEFSKPSELLELALRDLKAVEKDPRYEVNMGFWHRRRKGHPKCSVCLAGAVLAMSAGMGLEEIIEDPDQHLPNWAHALDALRMGYIQDAMYALDIHLEFSGPYIHPRSYDARAPEDFHKAMEELVQILKEDGL